MSEGKLNPLRLSVADAALLLSKAGGQPVSDELVKEAIAAGAPTGPDGNLNLVHLGAWLLKELTKPEQQ
jgi:hypothetical protein